MTEKIDLEKLAEEYDPLAPPKCRCDPEDWATERGAHHPHCPEYAPPPHEHVWDDSTWYRVSGRYYRPCLNPPCGEEQSADALVPAGSERISTGEEWADTLRRGTLPPSHEDISASRRPKGCGCPACFPEPRP